MLRSLFKTMRPKQWAKNIFIFAPLVFDRKLTDIDAVLNTILGAILFSLIASVVYIINDIADVEADRKHPTKRNRPIAAGKLAIIYGLGGSGHYFACVLSAGNLALLAICRHLPDLPAAQPGLLQVA